MGRKKAYEAEGIKVLYEPALCIHAAECVHRLPGVFDPERRPWIDAAAAGADAIARVVERCPTGALTYELEPSDPEQADQEATVRLAPDGPLYLRGTITVTTPAGEETACSRVALCRCGQSKNKPFCDNAHLEAGFKG